MGTGITWTAECGCLASQLMDQGWEIHPSRNDHGNISSQHVAEPLAHCKQQLPCLFIPAVCIELPNKKEKDVKNKKPVVIRVFT